MELKKDKMNIREIMDLVHYIGYWFTKVKATFFFGGGNSMVMIKACGSCIWIICSLISKIWISLKKKVNTFIRLILITWSTV